MQIKIPHFFSRPPRHNLAPQNSRCWIIARRPKQTHTIPHLQCGRDQNSHEPQENKNTQTHLQTSPPPVASTQTSSHPNHIHTIIWQFCQHSDETFLPSPTPANSHRIPLTLQKHERRSIRGFHCATKPGLRPFSRKEATTTVSSSWSSR